MAGNTKQYVIDSSTVLAVLLPDETVQPTILFIDQLLENPNNILLAPTLIEYEVANAIKSAIIRDRIKKEEYLLVLKMFQELPITLSAVKMEEVLHIAIEMGLSCYDAAYFWLTRANKAHLITLDKRLDKIWKEEKVV